MRSTVAFLVAVVCCLPLLPIAAAARDETRDLRFGSGGRPGDPGSIGLPGGIDAVSGTLLSETFGDSPLDRADAIVRHEELLARSTADGAAYSAPMRSALRANLVRLKERAAQ